MMTRSTPLKAWPMAASLPACDWPERFVPQRTGMVSSTIGKASKRQGFQSGRISPGSSAASRCPSAATQTVPGERKKRWSWRIAEGFSKKNSVRPGAGPGVGLNLISVIRRAPIHPPGDILAEATPVLILFSYEGRCARLARGVRSRRCITNVKTDSPKD